MATDFFEHQEQARRVTRWLAPLFILALLGTAAAVAAVGIAGANLWSLWTYDDRVEEHNSQRLRAEDLGPEFREQLEIAREQGLPVDSLFEPAPPPLPEWQWTWWWPRVALGTGGISLLIMLGAALQKRSELTGRGRRVAELLGGRPADPRKSEPALEGGLSERQLVHVVEEMAIASGLPVPQVYVLHRERSINAFAAGLRPEEACIAVTLGTLQHLSRDELQAVVAHELSHILHGDTVINQRMIAIVYGIGGLGMLGSGIVRVLFTPMGDDDEGGIALGHPIGWAALAIGISIAVAGSVGAGAARLLQAVTCRQREYLADASAVQFTRNPPGLTGALKKVGGIRRRGRLLNLHASEIAHMCIAPSSHQVVATHPPLVKRIRRMEPGFDGYFERIQFEDPEVTRRLHSTQRRIQREFEEERRQEASLRTAQSLLAASVVASAGQMDPPHVEAARNLLDELPETLRDAVHETLGAMAVVVSLILDPEEEARRQQLEAIGEMGVSIAIRAQELHDEVAALSPRHRLPLLDLALPTLELLSQGKRHSFVRVLETAVDSDEDLSFRELCFSTIVRHALCPRKPKGRGRQVYAVQGYSEQLAMVLGMLSGFNVNPQTAYTVACERLRLRRVPSEAMEPTPREVSAALDALFEATPPIKRRIIETAATCVAVDGVIEPEEHELLRAMAGAMGVPLPPAVVAVATEGAVPQAEVVGAS